MAYWHKKRLEEEAKENSEIWPRTVEVAEISPGASTAEWLVANVAMLERASAYLKQGKVKINDRVEVDGSMLYYPQDLRTLQAGPRSRYQLVFVPKGFSRSEIQDDL